MPNVLERLSEAGRSIERMDFVQRLGRAKENVQTSKIVRQLKLAPKSPARRLLTAFLIAIVAATFALTATRISPLRESFENLDNAFYDSMYARRTPESCQNRNVVMISIDDYSVQTAYKELNQDWPWPRDAWASMVNWLQKSGAKVIVFDILFESASENDGAFIQSLDTSPIPIVLAEQVQDDGKRLFGLKVTRPPVLGAVNIKDAVVRRYEPQVGGVPTLAMQAYKAFAGHDLPAWARDGFRLHFFGASKQPDQSFTFRQFPALDVLRASMDNSAALHAISPEKFAGKIVVIGATAHGINDIKSAPIADAYPGPEAHVTAITDLLEGRYVRIVPVWVGFAVAFLASMFATTGTILPKRTWLKLLMPATGLAGVFIFGYLLFVPGRNIIWLPLAMPLLATALAALAGISWTYFVEDRQRRVLRKFLAQYVSPEVAHRLDEIGTVSLGGVQRELSLLFSDIAGFTTLSEQMEPDQLEKFMNYYLSEMSAIVFAFNGTLDKYIGDALMGFWNAPLDQADHAILACRTALGMHRREEEIRPKLAEMGAGHIYTRIGVNTGLVKVGNYGSMQKLNYTAIGDNVNLASRLEGANKIYGSQILVAQTTVDLVGDRFLFRKLDLLKVKGKDRPMAVYELICQSPGTELDRKKVEEFERALAAYQQRNWDESERILVVLGEQFPDDGPRQALLERVREYRSDPPPADWDGSYIAKSK